VHVERGVALRRWRRPRDGLEMLLVLVLRIRAGGDAVAVGELADRLERVHRRDARVADEALERRRAGFVDDALHGGGGRPGHLRVGRTDEARAVRKLALGFARRRWRRLIEARRAALLRRRVVAGERVLRPAVVSRDEPVTGAAAARAGGEVVL